LTSENQVDRGEVERGTDWTGIRLQRNVDKGSGLHRDMLA